MWALPPEVDLVGPLLRAQLPGYRRAFCVPSRTYRGTVGSPGLVLGLQEEAGASCDGFALQLGPIDSARAHCSVAAVDAQEMVPDSAPAVYLRRWLDLIVEGHQQPVRALCYVANPEATVDAAISVEERAAVIVHSSGQRGPNIDYLTQVHALNTAAADWLLRWQPDYESWRYTTMASRHCFRRPSVRKVVYNKFIM